MRKAIRAGDAPALRSAAHAVKGAVANFAAPCAAEAAARLQHMGDTGHLAGADGALERLEREIARVLEALHEAAPGPPRKAPPARARKPSARPRATRAKATATPPGRKRSPASPGRRSRRAR